MDLSVVAGISRKDQDLNRPEQNTKCMFLLNKSKAE